MLVLWNRVGDDDLIDRRCVQTGQSIARKNSMGDQGVDVSRSLALDQLGSAGNGVGGIGQIINDDRDAASDIADKHHGRVLAVRDAGWATLLVCISYAPVRGLT